MYFVFKGYTCNNRLSIYISFAGMFMQTLGEKLNCMFCCLIVSVCKLVFTEKTMVRGSEHFFICIDWYFKY